MNVILEELEKNIKVENFASVYIFHGDEPFFYEGILAKIEEKIISDQDKSFNQFVFWGKDLTIPAFWANVKRFPFMAEKQLIIIKEMQLMAGFGDKGFQKSLQEYLAKPLVSTVLVLQFSEALDERKTWFKTTTNQVSVFGSKKMYDNKVGEWLGNYCRNKGVKISVKAIALLVENIGNEPKRLANEVEKMIMNLTVSQEISSETVEAMVGISKEYNVFELQKALISKNIFKANQIVIAFGANPKNNPLISVIIILYNFFSKLLLIQVINQTNEQALAGVLGVNPYFVKDYLTAKRSYSFAKTIRIIGYLKEADLQSKGIEASGGSESEILKNLIFKIIN